MKKPLISVIIPTYNRAALLPRCLDSVVAQTFDDWEIVLIDDGSTDDTEAVARAYDARIKGRLQYARQDQGGPGAARNHGIDRARGDFVAFLDSDDEFVPTKLARQLQLFTLQPQLGFVYSDYSCVDPTGGGYTSAFDAKYPLARSVPFAEVTPNLCICTTSLFDALFEGYFVSTITGMVRREVLGASIRFDPSIRYGEEWLFYLRVARETAAGFVNERLSIHHAVPGSLARTDRNRNSVRYVRLLQAVDASFPGLTRNQRVSLRKRMGRAWRQVGYDAIRAGRARTAARALISALRCERRLATFVELMSLIPSLFLQRPMSALTK